MLTFDKENHIYYWNEEQVPNVTSVIEECGFINTEYIDPIYALRGQYIHKITELYDLGTLDPESVDHQLQPWLDAYIQFKNDMGDDYEILEVEKKFYHNVYNHNYAGCIDRICRIDGDLASLDIKSGSTPIRFVELQLSAYNDYIEYEYGEGEFSYGYELKLHPEKPKKDDKLYTLRKHDNRFDKFQKCLDLYNYKHEDRRRKK